MSVKPTRVEALNELLAKYKRVGVTGPAGSGKTELVTVPGFSPGRPVFACDDGLPRSHDELVAGVKATCPEGPVLIEGMALPWAMRAGLQLDAVLVLTEVFEPHPQASNLDKGWATVMAELAPSAAAIVKEPMKIDIDAFGEVGFEISSTRIAALLTPDVTHVNMRLHSPGGDAVDGFAIYNLLSQHPAHVTVTVIGEASSAASYILQAADVRRINANAIIMTHRSQGGVRGNAEDLEARGKALRTIDDSIAGVYAARTGKPIEDAKAEFLSQADKYWSAEEAKAAGLVDEVLPDKAPAEALRACKEERLRGAPASFLAAVAAARSEPVSTGSTGAKVTMAFNPQEMAAELAKLTTEQRKALIKHGESVAELNGLFATDEVLAQAAVGQAVAKATGQTGEKVVGAVLALQSNAERLAAVESELGSSAVERDLDADKDKVPAAHRAKAIEQFKAKNMTLAGVKAAIEMLQPIPGLAGNGRVIAGQAQGGVSASGERTKTADGKTYAERKPPARAALKRTDRPLFDTLRAEAEAAGELN